MVVEPIVVVKEEPSVSMTDTIADVAIATGPPVPVPSLGRMVVVPTVVGMAVPSLVMVDTISDTIAEVVPTLAEAEEVTLAVSLAVWLPVWPAPLLMDFLPSCQFV